MSGSGGEPAGNLRAIRRDFAHGVRLGQDQPMRRRDRQEWFWIGLLVVTVALMAGLTAWPWFMR